MIKGEIILRLNLQPATFLTRNGREGQRYWKSDQPVWGLKRKIIPPLTMFIALASCDLDS